MDPIIILILAMLVLGLSHIAIDYEIRRAKRAMRNMGANMDQIGQTVVRLAIDAGWTATHDGTGTELTAPRKHRD